MKPIEMICLTSDHGTLRPLRFRWLAEDGTPQVIRIDRVLSMKEEKHAGNRMLVFDVQSQRDGMDHRFEMKYELRTMIWYLSRM